MVRRSGKEHDFITVARHVVEKSIGEHLDGKPLKDPNEGKSPHALALAKLGAVKGGKVRAERLSVRRRSEIAKNAARARWDKASD